MTSDRLDFRNRAERFAELEQGEFDLLVIGAGIAGAGVARDAAMRGLSVALVDAADIAAGTSSRSSKLIHGGMRYLAAGQIGVVREAATERKALRRIAPHLAQTTLMVVPAKTRRTLLKFRAGMVAYEKLGEVAKAERHEVWDVDRLGAEEPELLRERLVGAIAYPEYTTNDARLTLANVRSAAAAGAAVLTYASVLEILVENGSARGAIVESTIDAEVLGARLRAKIVVNAAGPWLDAVRKLEDADAPAKLQLTKGIHVVLRRDRLPVNNTVIMSTPDKRGIFVVPKGPCVYLGTTDTFYAEPDYWPEITEDDVDYLLDTTSKTFACGPFETEDVIGLWSGVRPLLAHEGKSPSEISRRNEILEGPGGVLSIAGGKLTSYRSMAERIVDGCLKRLERPRTASATADSPLPGGNVEADLAPVERALKALGMDDVEAERAAQLYGSEAEDVFAKGIGPEAEAEYAVLNEGALTLEDYWVRRSGRARFDLDGGLAALEPASRRMAGLLDWSEDERARQVEHCRDLRNRELRSIQHTKGKAVAVDHHG